MPDEVEFSEGLRQMAGVLLSEETLQAVLDLVVSLALKHLSNADGVSVTLRRDGQFETSSAQPIVVHEIDLTQYRHGVGPCIAATESGEVVEALLAEHNAKWPDFVSAALERGFASVLSIPMHVRDGDAMGSLNVYSCRDDHFSSDEQQEAATFAHYAAVVVTNAASFATTEKRNDQLRIALLTRERIGEAKGIMMTLHGVTSDEAFTLLRRQSQRTNRKLRDIAQDVIDTAVESHDGG